jgi:hypothetical protein
MVGFIVTTVTATVMLATVSKRLIDPSGVERERLLLASNDYTS